MRMRYVTLPYNRVEFNFVELVSKLYRDTPLEQLHTQSIEKYETLFEVGKDSSTVFHEIFYNKYRAGWPEMIELYEKFIAWINNEYDIEEGQFLYQKFPTFRVHLPGNIAVGKFHKDSEFNHPRGEINFILPLTDSEDTASVWVESFPDKGDFEAMKLKVGQLITFNGNELTHGNRINETGKTRVSMDFRILPASRYNEAEQSESLTLKTKFKEGEYYKRFNVSK